MKNNVPDTAGNTPEPQAWMKKAMRRICNANPTPDVACSEEQQKSMDKRQREDVLAIINEEFSKASRVAAPSLIYGDAFNLIGLLRSVVACGEKLTKDDDAEISRVLHALRVERDKAEAAPSQEAAPEVQYCHADRDGDCNWDKCPQLANRQSYCPLASAEEDAEVAEPAPLASQEAAPAQVAGFGDWCDSHGVLPTMGVVENYASDRVRRAAFDIKCQLCGFRALACGHNVIWDKVAEPAPSPATQQAAPTKPRCLCVGTMTAGCPMHDPDLVLDEERGTMLANIIKQDTGGNSTLTRLRADVACNKDALAFAQVTDSSLMHSDLRKLLMLIETLPAPSPAIKCKHCGQPMFDNGTVGVHIRFVNGALLQSQWCDDSKKVFAEPDFAVAAPSPATKDTPPVPQSLDVMCAKCGAMPTPLSQVRLCTECWEGTFSEQEQVAPAIEQALTCAATELVTRLWKHTIHTEHEIWQDVERANAMVRSSMRRMLRLADAGVKSISQGPAREETPQWIRESKPQSVETMVSGIVNDLLGINGPTGATTLLTARLSAWKEAIIGKTLAYAGAQSRTPTNLESRTVAPQPEKEK